MHHAQSSVGTLSLDPDVSESTYHTGRA